MKKFELGPTVKIDPVEYATQGNAILGIIKSGKSYTATYIAERLLDAGIPFIAFDPIGIWKYLKVGAKARKKGYDVVVVGGDRGDIPLRKDAVVGIVRAAMKESISLVIDFYSMDLSKADWRYIVEQVIHILLYENKAYGMRHIFLEEAAEFVPQRIQPEHGRVYAEIEKLARMGGNASLGFTLINQRAEEVNKAVLELCECIITHRQRGRNSLNALGKWMDYMTDTHFKTQIMAEIPQLEQGECYVWLGDKVLRTKVHQKTTFHYDRRKPSVPKKAQVADISSFIKKITRHVEVQHEEKETVASLKKRIRDLEKGRAHGKEITRPVAHTRDDIGRAVRDAERKVRADFEHQLHSTQKEIARFARYYEAGVSSLTACLKQFTGAVEILKNLEVPKIATVKKEVTPPISDLMIPRISRKLIEQVDKNLQEIKKKKELSGDPIKFGPTPLSIMGAVSEYGSVRVSKEGMAAMSMPGDISLGKCERSILGFLYHNPARTWSKEQIGIMTGYSSQSGGFNNALARLNTLKYIAKVGTNIRYAEGIPSDLQNKIEKAGVEFTPENIRQKLGKCEREIYDVVTDQELGETFSREELAAHTASKYQATSGGFNNALSRLRTLGVIERIGGRIELTKDMQELLGA